MRRIPGLGRSSLRGGVLSYMEGHRGKSHAIMIGRKGSGHEPERGLGGAGDGVCKFFHDKEMSRPLSAALEGAMRVPRGWRPV